MYRRPTDLTALIYLGLPASSFSYSLQSAPALESPTLTIQSTSLSGSLAQAKLNKSCIVPPASGRWFYNQAKI